jgi:hypothetical protein
MRRRRAGEDEAAVLEVAEERQGHVLGEVETLADVRVDDSVEVLEDAARRLIFETLDEAGHAGRVPPRSRTRSRRRPAPWTRGG